MSDAATVDELLRRLVDQFESPYDFLRELVQNSMDAGSDRVDVALYVHETTGGEVVFELECTDAGAGMDEAIIDGELTRLFASSKSGDRTMAGGFGVGFVSVFAWEPHAVLVQTGRQGQAWELLFHADRTFEKHALAEPFEGTSVRLFRLGRLEQRPQIAAAIRDSLWRWCRYCACDIEFTDAHVGRVERIKDESNGTEDPLTAVHQVGDTTVRVAFGIPPHVVLLRRGLVLAEGSPTQHLARVAPVLSTSFEHLRVWADSSALRTDIGRDHVIDDVGRRGVEQIVSELVVGLRDDLIARLEGMASASGPWTVEVHANYGYLHAHLACERDSIGSALDKRGVLRRAIGGATSVAALVRRASWGVVATVVPARAGEPQVAVADRGGVPVLIADREDAGAWLRAWLDTFDVELVELDANVRAVTAAAGDGATLAGLVAAILVKAGVASEVCVGSFDGPADQVWGLQLSADPPSVVVGVRRFAADQRVVVWLDARHVLVRAAMIEYTVRPLVAAATLAFAVVGTLPRGAIDLDDVADAVDELAASAASRPAEGS